MICPKCGRNIDSKAQKCDFCGCDISSEKRTQISDILRRKFSSLTYYAAVSLLSLSVLLKIIAVLFGEDKNPAIVTYLGLDSLFKPVENALGNVMTAVSLLVVLPAALFCLGMWMIPVIPEGKYQGNNISFTFIRAATVLRTVYYGAFGAIISILFANAVSGTYTYAERFVTVAFIILGLLTALATVSLVVYFIKTVKLARALEYTLKNGRLVNYDYKFIRIFNYLICVFLAVCAIGTQPFTVCSYFADIAFVLIINRVVNALIKQLRAGKGTAKPQKQKIQHTSSKESDTQKPYVPHETEQVSFAIPNKNKKYCVKCGEMIAEEATYCPYCHANQDPENQQHFKI